MRVLRKFLIYFFGFLLIANVLILVTGNTHLYKGLKHTYLVGRAGPEIDDLPKFPFESIAVGAPQPWPKSTAYGQVALSEAQENELNELYTVAYLVIKDGQLLYENYWNGWGADSTFNSFSVGKSFVSTLTGMAMRDGHVESVFDPVGKYLPEFQEGKKSEILLHHLLTMSTGLNYSESGADPFSSNAKAYYGSDLKGLIDDLEVVDPIGKEFDYISGSTEIMGWVLEAATGKTLDVLAEEYLWKPLGATHPAYWSKDRADGTIKSFCCYYSTARDFARLGQLYLNNGVWSGQQLLPGEFIEAATRPADLMDKGKPNSRYGFFWWLHPEGDEPFYYARGYHGQYIIVIPSQRMVIVRGGYKREQVNAVGHPDDIYKYIEMAHTLVQQR